MKTRNLTAADINEVWGTLVNNGQYVTSIIWVNDDACLPSKSKFRVNWIAAELLNYNAYSIAKYYSINIL